jgi:hypothetical protein
MGGLPVSSNSARVTCIYQTTTCLSKGASGCFGSEMPKTASATGGHHFAMPHLHGTAIAEHKPKRDERLHVKQTL